MLPGGAEHGRLHHQVVVRKIDRLRDIGPNAAYLTGGVDHVFRPRFSKPAIDGGLIAQIEFRVRCREDVGEARVAEAFDQRRTDESAMTRDIDPAGACDDSGHEELVRGRGRVEPGAVSIVGVMTGLHVLVTRRLSGSHVAA